MRNFKSVLGPSPWLWCCPTKAPGTGLRYELSNSEGELLHLSHITAPGWHEDTAHLA
jgi:hypothetical protein